MTLRGGTYVAQAVLVAVAAGAAWGSGGVYRDSSGRFSVELPDGWALRPASEVADANAALSSMQPFHQFSYTAKFTPADAKTELAPFVLVQWTPAELGNAKWSQIESALGASEIKRVSEEVGDRLSAVVSNLSVGQVAVDEGRRRYAMRLSMDVEGKRLLAQCVGIVGRHGMAQLNCYALEPEFASVQPKFDAMAETLRFEAGQEYSEPSFVSRINWDSILVRGLVLGLIGGVIGAIFRSRSGGKKRRAGVVKRRPRGVRRPPPAAPRR